MNNLFEINKKYNIDKRGIKNNSIYINCEGGDKYSEKNYHLIYEKYFKNYIFKKINFLEIGILEGFSLAVHSDYFPDANLYGYDIDISPFNKNYDFLKSIGCFSNNNLKGIKQINSLDNLNIDIKFDIILDDGDHNPCAQVKTFENYFNYLNEDGIYIIEDITDFRLECLKIYFKFLNIDFKFERKHKTHGSIIINFQKIHFNNKDLAYQKMCEYKPLIKHYKWLKKEYKKLNANIQL